LHLCETSCAASIAAYGEDSSLSALTFIPPVHVRFKEIHSYCRDDGLMPGLKPYARATVQ